MLHRDGKEILNKNQLGNPPWLGEFLRQSARYLGVDRQTPCSVDKMQSHAARGSHRNFH